MSPHEDLAARKLEYEAIPVQESALRSTLATPPLQHHSSPQEVPDKPVSGVSLQPLTLRQRPSEVGHSVATSEVCDPAPNQVAILLCSDKSILEAVNTVKGRSVQKLTFAIEEVVSDEMVLRRRGWWQNHQLRPTEEFKRQYPKLERTGWEFEALEAQQRIREGNVDVAALTELFEGVKKHGEPVEIELAHGDEELSDPTCSRPEHFEEYKNACCQHGFSAPASDDIRSFEVLLKAMVISRFEVKSLTVVRSFEDGAWSLPIHLIMMKDDLATHFKNTVQHTDELDLSVWVEDVNDEVQGEEYARAVKDSVLRFANILAEAPKLKSLSLHVDFDSHNFDVPGYNQTSPALLLNTNSAECRSLFAALLEQTFPHLETLAISFGSLDVEKLLAFIKRQPKLQGLNLEDINLLENGKTRIEIEQLAEEVGAAVPGSSWFNYSRIGGRVVVD